MIKINELSLNEPLKVEEATCHIEFIAFLDPKPRLNQNQKAGTEIKEFKRIQTKIFTDGEILKLGGEKIEEIDEYYIGKKKYQYDVDTLKTKEIFFKNYSYIITYLLANEPMQVGSIHGWFDVIKNISIYLKDAKDKKALKEAKKVIEAIRNCNNNVNYNSLLGMLFSQQKEAPRYEYEKMTENVYTLKKSK